MELPNDGENALMMAARNILLALNRGEKRKEGK
jgi:hypothetical protein